MIYFILKIVNIKEKVIFTFKIYAKLVAHYFYVMNMYPSMVSWHKKKFKMARSEPLIQEADPHITKLANRTSDVGTDGPNKK